MNLFNYKFKLNFTILLFRRLHNARNYFRCFRALFPNNKLPSCRLKQVRLIPIRWSSRFPSRRNIFLLMYNLKKFLFALPFRFYKFQILILSYKIISDGFKFASVSENYFFKIRARHECSVSYIRYTRTYLKFFKICAKAECIVPDSFKFVFLSKVNISIAEQPLNDDAPILVIVYQPPPEFQVLDIALQYDFDESHDILFSKFLSALYNEAGFYFFQVCEQHFAFLHTLFDALFQ